MSKLQSDFTTREQSKRLLELGVPADSANLFYSRFEGETFENRPTLCYGRKYSDIVPSRYEKNYLPCWSVGRLIEILKVCIIDKSELEEIFEHLKDCIYTVDALLQMYKEWKDFIDFLKLEE